MTDFVLDRGETYTERREKSQASRERFLELELEAIEKHAQETKEIEIDEVTKFAEWFLKHDDERDLLYELCCSVENVVNEYLNEK